MLKIEIKTGGAAYRDEDGELDRSAYELRRNLKEIEEKVNQIVFEGRPVVIKNMTKEEALASGAMALFDEKYGDVVRVVNIGDYSIELCGGCHVSNSSEIGLFKIVSEESVGSGIRRIVAQSGLAAYNAMVHEKETVDTIASTLNLKNRKDVVSKVESLKEDLKEAKDGIYIAKKDDKYGIIDNIENENLRKLIIAQMLKCDKCLTNIAEEIFNKRHN